MSNVAGDQQLPMATMPINNNTTTSTNTNTNTNSNTNNNAQTTFSCKTCGKPFISVQALGGHQNAHRTERFTLKRRQIEMKRQLARQASLLPRAAGPSAAAAPPNWPPAYIINSMVPVVDAVAEDVAEGIDLTLKL